MRKWNLIPAILCLFYFFVNTNTLKSQVIFTESFEGTFPPAGWTIINAGTGNPWAENTVAAYSFDGVKAMQRTASGNVASNTWAFTQNLALAAGYYYRISYWYREALPGRVEKMRVTLGTSATIAAQTTILHDYTDISNLNYLQGSDVFSVPSSGNYNIAFYCNSPNGNVAELLIDGVVFEQSAPLTCSGNPTVGSITGPPSVCSGVNFILNLSGTYISSGLTLQWQSSPASANTFTNIPGATSQSYSATQTSAKDYRCVVSCSNGGASVISNVFPVLMRTLCYCIPPADDCSLAYLSNVTIGSLNNNSACSGGGYTNYSGIAATPNLVPGTTMPISVTPGGIALTQNVAVWIDYNRNGLFEATEYKNLGSGFSTITNTIDVSAGALIGLTTMRVRTKSGSAMASSSSCTGYSDGETEDYTVNIALPPCSGIPSGGTTVCTVSNICPDINFVVKTSGSTVNNAGLSYQWQRSPDGSAWADISNAVADSLIISQTTATYYRRKITCSISGQTVYSTSLQIGINAFNNCYCIPPASDCGSFRYAGIENVLFSNINNSSGCGANGYTDYTGSVAAAAIQAGTYVPMTITFLSQNNINAKGVVVGIDFNHNGIFDNAESFFASSITQVLINIRIPYNALTGLTRMRVRASFTSSYSPGFCAADTYGETEDYMVNISPATTPGPNFSFYVNPLATGNGIGLSWNNAFTSLMTALSVVLPGDTIRAAKATYTVSGAPYYFNIKDSVVLLGGYPNTGNPGDALRNWGANPTILSGAGVPVTVRGASGFTLDGFFLQDVYSYPTEGGAIRITNGVLPKIKHCVFRNNYCVSNGTGSAMRISNSSPVISDCFFINNKDNYGATVSIESGSSPVFNNCIFSKNTALTSIIETYQSTASLINCDLVSNRANTNATLYGHNNSTFNIKNTIFFNNEKQVSAGYGGYSTDSTDIELSSSTVNISNTITQSFDYGNGLLLSKNPKFKDTSSIAGPDNIYYTADDGLQLNNPCSPAMNTGSNADASGITIDILGNSRIISSIVDIGAYEIQTAPLPIPGTLYVNKLAVGDGSGSTWANAMTDLQAAMQSCSDTVRVAAGTYYPSDSDEKKSIWLENKRVILGGYPNTGNPTDAERDPSVNLTILSGEMPNSNGKRSDILLRARTVDSTSVTNGLVIKKAESSVLDAMGAVYLVNNSNPVFRNCTISDNNSNGQGAGLFIKNSGNPKFENCIFENNSLTNIGEGGAAAIINSTPVFRKCLFRFNSNYIAGVTPSSGGAVYNSGSNSIFDSCTFIKNIGNNWAGAMDNLNSNPVITNCWFLGNQVAAGNANDINNNHSSPQVINTFFSDSTGCNYGGAIVNLNQSNPSFIACEFKNSHASNGGACYNDNSSPFFLNCIFNATGAGDGGVLNNQNSSNPVMINCLAIGNSAGGQGSFMYNSNSSPVIKNTTIVNGTLPSTGNSFRGGVIVNYGTTQVTLSNSILWGNTVVSGQNVPNGDILDITNTATPTLMNNSISQVFGTTGVNGNLVAVDPLFIGLANPAGADNIYYTNDDGLNLASCSPAVNAGLNNSIAGYNTDIVNNPRIYNSIVDMGAYELQAMPGLVTNTWTGTVNTSWENPLNWSLGILPNPCTKVIINSGTIQLSSNSTIYNLTINPGVNLTVNTGYNLIILH